MSTGKNAASNSSSGNAIDQRTKKAAATRAITQAKLEGLSPQLRYAHSKLASCRRALAELADHVENGGSVSGDLLAAVASLEGQVGSCLFTSR